MPATGMAVVALLSYAPALAGEVVSAPRASEYPVALPEVDEYVGSDSVGADERVDEASRSSSVRGIDDDALGAMRSVG